MVSEHSERIKRRWKRAKQMPLKSPTDPNTKPILMVILKQPAGQKMKSSFKREGKYHEGKRHGRDPALVKLAQSHAPINKDESRKPCATPPNLHDHHKVTLFHN